MNERLKTRFNKLSASAAALLLSGLALNACSAEKEIPTPACALNIDSHDTLPEIVKGSHVFDNNNNAGVAEIEVINTGIDADRLTAGDDVALGAKMCKGLLNNRDYYYRITILDAVNKQ